MLLNGLNKIRDVHKDNIDKAWVGTASDVVTEAQTGLVYGVTATKLTATTDNSADKTNVVEYTLPSTVGTAVTYREFAFILDGTVEYNRVIYTGIEHTENEDVVFKQTIFYRNL